MDLVIKCNWYGYIRTEKDGKITIYTFKQRKKYRIAYLNFSVYETQVNVDNLYVHKYYRGKGFGRLLMNMIMGLASEVGKPLYVIGTDKSAGFYTHIGMRQVFYCRDWEDVKVTIENHNPKKKLCEICSDLDFVWIPTGMREIRLWL